MKFTDAIKGKKPTKNFRFMDQDIPCRKLSYGELAEMQAMAQKAMDESLPQAEKDRINAESLIFVIKSTVDDPDVGELTDADWKEIPFDDLNKLTQDILEYSGMGKTPR